MIRAWAAAAALTVAGCGSGADERAGAANASAAAAPAPAQSANAAAAAPEAPAPAAVPTLTAEGYGPLRIGMTLAEVNSALGPDSDPEAVGGPEPEVCDQFRPARAPEGLLVMIEEGRLARITLHEAAPVATDRGLRVGAAAAVVRAAYGAAVSAEPHEYQEPPAEYLTIWTRGAPAAGGGTTDPAARGMRYEVASDGRVAAIHAGGPAIQYVEGCL